LDSGAFQVSFSFAKFELNRLVHSNLADISDPLERKPLSSALVSSNTNVKVPQFLSPLFDGYLSSTS
jgi:hypothetical protein